MYIQGKRFSVTMPRKHYNYAHKLFLYRRLVCYAYAGQALLNTTPCHLEVLIAAKLVNTLIGASLSEPHTSVTALRTCVCMLACLDRPLTVNFKWAYFTKIDVKHGEASGGLLSECNIGDPKRRQLKLKHVWHWFVLLPTTAGHSLAVVDWVTSQVEFQVAGHA